MDTPEILEAVIAQLPLREQLTCTLVSRRWYRAAKVQIDALYLKNIERLADQADCLRFLQLDKSTVSLLPALGQLSRLRTLVITPAARLSLKPSEADPEHTHNALAELLVQLPLLAHLTISGQDLRRTRPLIIGPLDELLSGTDEALIALARSRLTNGLPGLRSLSITASPDVSDHGIISYLTSTASSARIVAEHSTCGYSLTSIALVNCPRLTTATLLVIARSCSKLQSTVLKSVEGIFQPNEQASVTSPSEALAEFAQRCKALQSLTLSLREAKMSQSAFDSFTDHPSLRSLSVSNSRHFSRQHLASFNTLRRLTISGCPAPGVNLPFVRLPDLRELTYLGLGLSISSVWELFMHCKYLQRLSMDVAEQCWRSARDIDSGPQAPSADTALPEALTAFSALNVLSAHLPSWALAYLLSFAPPFLEAISLNGTSMETENASYSTPPAFRAWWLEQRKLAFRRHYGYNGHGTYTEALLWIFGIRLPPQAGAAWWSYPWSVVRKAFEHSENCQKRKNRSSAGSATLQVARMTGHPRVRSAAPPRYVSRPSQTNNSAGPISAESSMNTASSSCASFGYSKEVGSPTQACPRKMAVSWDESSRNLADLLRLPDPMAAAPERAYAARSRMSPEQTEWLQAVTCNQFARLDV